MSVSDQIRKSGCATRQSALPSRTDIISHSRLLQQNLPIPALCSRTVNAVKPYAELSTLDDRPLEAT
jgi:hypothetical protein